MSDKTRRPYAVARALAEEAVELLAPFCERIEIAGSLRREREWIGDIELVAVPLFGERTVDLFGATESVNLLREQVEHLLASGELRRRLDRNGRPAVGDRHARLTYQGMGLDLFAVLPPAEWGVIFTLRTGSAEFSHRLVTPVEQGGWMPRGMVCQNGRLWNIMGAHWLPIPTPDEASLFAALRRRYVEPCDREVESRPAPPSARRTWLGVVNGPSRDRAGVGDAL